MKGNGKGEVEAEMGVLGGSLYSNHEGSLGSS